MSERARSEPEPLPNPDFFELKKLPIAPETVVASPETIGEGLKPTETPKNVDGVIVELPQEPEVLVPVAEIKPGKEKSVKEQKEELLQIIEERVEKSERENAEEICWENLSEKNQKKMLKEDGSRDEAEFQAHLTQMRDGLRKKAELSSLELSDSDIDAIINHGYYVDRMESLSVLGFGYEIPNAYGDNRFVPKTWARFVTMGMMDASVLAARLLSPVLPEEYHGKLASLKTTLKELRDLSNEAKNERVNAEINREIKPDELKELLYLKREEYIENNSNNTEVGEKKEAKNIEALGLCYSQINRTIEKAGQDTAPEEIEGDLFGIVEEFTSEFDFSDDQRENIGRIISGYFEARQSVKNLREQYKDDIELVNELTGTAFIQADKDRLEVLMGPMSIDIIADADAAEEIYKALGGTNKNTAFCFGGLKKKLKAKSVFITVVKRGSKEEAHIDHERMHVESDISGQVIDRKINLGDEGFIDLYNGEPDDYKKKLLLTKVLFLKREQDFQRIAREIFSMKKDSVSTYYRLFFDGGVYDKLADFRNMHSSNEKNSKNRSFRKDWKELSNEILVKEYKRKFNESLEAFERLEEHNYEIDHIIAMLRLVPFEKWDTFANQLIGPEVEKLVPDVTEKLMPEPVVPSVESTTNPRGQKEELRKDNAKRAAIRGREVFDKLNKKAPGESIKPVVVENIPEKGSGEVVPNEKNLEDANPKIEELMGKIGNMQKDIIFKIDNSKTDGATKNMWLVNLDILDTDVYNIETVLKEGNSKEFEDKNRLELIKLVKRLEVLDKEITEAEKPK